MENIVVGYRGSIELLDTHRFGASRLERRPRMDGEFPLAGWQVSVRSRLAHFGLPAPRFSGRRPTMSARLDNAHVPLPVDLLIPDARGMRGNRVYRPHSWKRGLSLDDVVQVGKDAVYACHPGLALVQMSVGLPLARIIEVGLMLAGTYRELRPEAVPYYRAVPKSTVELFPRGSTDATCTRATAYGLEPLISVRTLESYVNSLERLSGVRRVRSALPFLCDGIASPLEARFWILATLPMELGGLGLPRPLVNHVLELCPGAAAFVGKCRIVPDFYWPDHGIVVETDGALYHGRPDGIVETSLRHKAYRTEGIYCFTLTYAEVADPALFERFSEELASALGMPCPSGDTPSEATLRLRRDLGLDRAPSPHRSPVIRPCPQEVPPSPFEDPGWFEAITAGM